MIQAGVSNRRAPADALGELDLNKLARQALEPWSLAFDSWRSGLNALVRPKNEAPADHCGCQRCAPDPCGCRCCVTDADLVVEARVGERRIVPIVIENPWRRERDIELELSGWTSIGEDVAISGQIVTPPAFKLQPCGREDAVLVIGVAHRQNGEQPIPTPNDQKANRANNGDNIRQVPTRLPDVGRCEVAYADLRIKGCDMRSIRIAVAVLPRTCDAYTVDCGCACC